MKPAAPIPLFVLLSACAPYQDQSVPAPLPGVVDAPYRSRPPRAPRPQSPNPALPGRPQASTWQPSEAIKSQSLGRGATHHQFTASREGERVEVQLVVFDSRYSALRVIDQPSPRAGGWVISQLMSSHRALAGVNGGFFHPNFEPLGELVANGRKLGKFTDNRLISGSVLVVNREPYLVWNAEFLGESGVSELIQGGPRLIDAGQPIPRLNASKSAPRTFVATDGKRMWAIGVVRATTLAGLADLLATPGLLPDIRIRRALNLDGGQSTAFWARTAAGHEISQPGWSTVRSYLAVVPK